MNRLMLRAIVAAVFAASAGVVVAAAAQDVASHRDPLQGNPRPLGDKDAAVKHPDG